MNRSIPVYKQIRNHLEELIARNRTVPNYKLPSENQLANLFHTSRIPVKRALDDLEAEGIIYRRQGKGSFISGQNGAAETQLRVGLLLPRLDSHLFGAITRGVNRVFAAEGVRLYNIITDDDPQQEEAAIRDCLQQHYDGMIVFPVVAHTYSDAFLQLVLRRYPVVLAGRSFPGLNVSYVSCSHYDQAYRAVGELIDMGYTSIAYLGEDGYSSPPYQERLSGYRDRMLETFSHDRLNICTVNFFDPALKDGEIDRIVHEAIEKLFLRPVDAVIVTNNAVVPLIDYLVAQKKTDTHLALFDYPSSTPTALHLRLLDRPPMIVYQNFYEIGKRAARLLLTQMREHTPPTQLSLEPTIYRQIGDLEASLFPATNDFYTPYV